MNKFILLFLVTSSLSCSNRKLLDANKQLNICIIESKVKNAIINELYRKIKTNERFLLAKKENYENDQSKLENALSRLKICRKDFLDCKIKKARESEHNNILIDQIEREVCVGKK